MYTNEDFKTKKALKEAVNSGKKIGIYQPGPFPVDTQNGTFSVEGPHYPKPHSWYALVTVQEGWIRSVK